MFVLTPELRAEFGRSPRPIVEAPDTITAYFVEHGLQPVMVHVIKAAFPTLNNDIRVTTFTPEADVAALVDTGAWDNDDFDVVYHHRNDPSLPGYFTVLGGTRETV